MAECYCPICRRVTPHKSIMRRSQKSQNMTRWQEVITLVVKGTHYYQMERQQYCRLCNHQNQLASIPSLYEQRV
jgi:ribosomal protein L44E